MKEMTFSQSRKTKPIQTQSNPIKPNFETTLIGISQAGAQDGMGDLRLTIANPDSSLR